MIDITIIPILKDNYSYILRAPCGTTAILDPALSDPIIDIFENLQIQPDYILNTHHHWDHTDGNAGIKARYGCPIVGPKHEADSFADIDILLEGGDTFKLGEQSAQIIETPGHTRGALCFYFAQSKVVFTGDTLFSMGCGRLFENTPAEMHESFQKLAALPDETKAYCGHEYTKGNAGFCLSQDKSNPDLRARIEEVKTLRAQNKPTIPTTIGLEKKTNIFMQAKSAEDFAALRKLKDNF